LSLFSCSSAEKPEYDEKKGAKPVAAEAPYIWPREERSQPRSLTLSLGASKVKFGKAYPIEEDVDSVKELLPEEEKEPSGAEKEWK
ncbi:MAG: hypothetical protein V3V26_02290, partial [Candidatus Aenigmarchaeota archaeon]